MLEVIKERNVRVANGLRDYLKEHHVSNRTVGITPEHEVRLYGEERHWPLSERDIQSVARSPRCREVVGY